MILLFSKIIPRIWKLVYCLYLLCHSSQTKKYIHEIFFFHICKQGACITYFFFFATGVSGIGISFHDSYLRILYCFLCHCFLEDRERDYTRKRNDSRIVKAEHHGRSAERVSYSIMEVRLLLLVGNLFVS